MAVEKNYSKSTLQAYDLLRLAKTPSGFFNYLAKLLEALKKDESSRYRMKKWMTDLKEREEMAISIKNELVEWMQEKLQIMRGLSDCEVKDVKSTLDELENVLSAKVWEIRSGGYVNVLEDYFRSACASLAGYGNRPEYDGWFSISVRKDLLCFEREKFIFLPSANKEKIEIKLSSKAGKQLTSILQGGYLKAHVLPNAWFFDDEKTVRVELERGEIEKIHYPEGFYTWRQLVDGSEAKEELDVSGVPNLHWLILLSRYIELDPKPLHSLPKPTSVIEAEKLCMEQLLQFYLSGFKASSWDQAPFSRKEILKIVDRFMLLLQIKSDFNYPGKNRTILKDEADKYAYRVLFSYIEKMSEEDRLQFTNANALKYIRGTNPSIYISEKAGSRICKIIRDETGWSTKPGKKVTKRR